MDSPPRPEPSVLWSFWLACGLAATGALVALVLTTGEINYRLGVAIPFGIAAVAMAAIARNYPRGRALATALYILAWIAVVYGILRMIAVPLQQVVAGACNGSTTNCGPVASPFAGGEGVAIAVGVITGALALQVAFVGLRALYRRPRKVAAATGYGSPPPTRIMAPVKAMPAPAKADEQPVAASAAIATEPATGPDPARAPQPARKPRPRRKAKPPVETAPPAEPAELPAHEELTELPAHEDAAELPAHVDPAELPPHSSTTSSG